MTSPYGRVLDTFSSLPQCEFIWFWFYTKREEETISDVVILILTSSFFKHVLLQQNIDKYNYSICLRNKFGLV